VIDFHGARVVAREKEINYYGAQGGGPSNIFDGVSTALWALAATGNILALLNFQGDLKDQECNVLMRELEGMYNHLANRADPVFEEHIETVTTEEAELHAELGEF